MPKFTVFYQSYSLDEGVEPEAAVRMSVEEILEALPRLLQGNGDFFGVVDQEGVTLQFMRGNCDRVWMEIPVPKEQGSYGKHSTLQSVLETVADLPPSFDSLRVGLTFQSWSGEGNSQKLYAVAKEDIKPLAEGYGWCFATDMITTGDRGVGYMYREEAEENGDSGWRFFCGHESQEYMDEPSHSAIYNVNTIANYDPDIIPLLDSPPGTAFGRDENGELVGVPFG